VEEKSGEIRIEARASSIDAVLLQERFQGAAQKKCDQGDKRASVAKIKRLLLVCLLASKTLAFNDLIES
jgi:hypothetical protein